MFLDYVNAKIGSENEMKFSHGNIYPVTAMPFGMAQFSVETDLDRGNWFYSPRSHAFEGIRLTHQASPWVGDFGHVRFLPFTGTLPEDPAKRWSGVRPEDVEIRPDRLSVYLRRYRISAALTPTVRGAGITLESEENCSLAVIPYGETLVSSDGDAIRFTMEDTAKRTKYGMRSYFYMRTSVPATVEPLKEGGFALVFRAKRVEIRLATGFIDEETTKRTYLRELDGKTANDLACECTARWEDLLSRIDVSGENGERKRTFYSCFYRALLYPITFYETDAQGEPVHYNADTGKAEDGFFYTDNGYWDTYRTVYPFLSVVCPETVSEMAEGILNYTKETGWLPRWLAPGELGIMPSVLSEAVVCDLAARGLFPHLDEIYPYMIKDANEVCADPRHGRAGIREYGKYGYVPADLAPSVNLTLDSAYCDFCVSEIARLLGKEDDASFYLARSKNYRNLFDPETSFFRPKDRGGHFLTPFDPYRWGDENCECSAWQNSFAAPHDYEGLSALYGGPERALYRLDEIFMTKPEYRVGGYGQEIHEMTEMAAVDLGQCAISNQPSFALPWLFAVFGDRKRTEDEVERIADLVFSATETGFPGDEDNGTMACWYLFACLGFYPATPGAPEYVTSKPLFDRITVRGKRVARFDCDRISHAELIKGMK